MCLNPYIEMGLSPEGTTFEDLEQLELKKEFENYKNKKIHGTSSAQKQKKKEREGLVKRLGPIVDECDRCKKKRLAYARKAAEAARSALLREVRNGPRRNTAEVEDLIQHFKRHTKEVVWSVVKEEGKWRKCDYTEASLEGLDGCDESQMKIMAEYLSDAGMESLYEFINEAERKLVRENRCPASENVPAEQLIERLDALKPKIAQAHRGGGVHHTWHELCGMARTALGKEAPHDRYRNGRHYEILRAKENSLRLFCRKGVLDYGKFEPVLVEATKAGVPEKFVWGFVNDFAKKQKCVVTVGGVGMTACTECRKNLTPGAAICDDCAAKKEDARKERKKKLEGIGKLVRDQRLEEADRRLVGLGGPGVVPLAQRIRDGLKQAKVLCAQAEALERRNPVAALDKYVEALHVCSDCGKAKERLEREPPGNLRVRWRGGSARLTWESAETRSMEHWVVRKKSGTPSGREDGERLKDGLPGTSFDDTSLCVGVPVHYAVFVRRKGIWARTGTSSGPHVLTSDPKNVSAVSGDRRVDLQWSRPKRCTAVEVWRKRGTAPSKPGDGQRVGVSGNAATDGGLENNQSYGYLVVAGFKDGKGGVRWSPGVPVEATPVAPPDPILDLSARRLSGTRKVDLRWTPPARGTAQIRQTQNLPGGLPAAGAAVPLHQAARYGKPLKVLRRGSAQADLPGSGLGAFIPLAVVDDTAVVGRPVSVTALDDVENVRLRRQGKTVRLGWRWPTSGAEYALVVYRHDRPPSGPQDGQRVPVNRQAGATTGSWIQRRAIPKPYHVRIHTCARGSAGEHCSEGVQASVDSGIKRRVFYHVKRSGGVLRHGSAIRIELRTDEDVDVLVGVRAVFLRDRLPLNADQGCVIASESRLVLQDGWARMEMNGKPGSGFVRLFFQDPARNPDVRLMAGSSNVDGLRVC